MFLGREKFLLQLEGVVQDRLLGGGLQLSQLRMTTKASNSSCLFAHTCIDINAPQLYIDTNIFLGEALNPNFCITILSLFHDFNNPWVFIATGISIPDTTEMADQMALLSCHSLHIMSFPFPPSNLV